MAVRVEEGHLKATLISESETRINHHFTFALGKIAHFWSTCPQPLNGEPEYDLRSYHHPELSATLEATAKTRRHLAAPLPDAGTLTTVPSNDWHSRILDGQQRLLAYRYRIPDLDVEILENSVEALADARRQVPPVARDSHNGQASAGHAACRNYAYIPALPGEHPVFSRDFVADLPDSYSFLLDVGGETGNHGLFRHLQRNLRVLAPEVARRFEGLSISSGVDIDTSTQDLFPTHGPSGYPLRAVPTTYGPLCYPFGSMALEDGTQPTGCTLHPDWADSASSLIFIVPFGQWTGGNVVLPELGMEIELCRGDVLLLERGILNYGFRPLASGHRGSLTLYNSEEALLWVEQRLAEITVPKEPIVPIEEQLRQRYGERKKRGGREASSRSDPENSGRKQVGRRTASRKTKSERGKTEQMGRRKTSRRTNSGN